MLSRTFQLLNVCGLIESALDSSASDSVAVRSFSLASTEASTWVLITNIHDWFNDIPWA